MSSPLRQLALQTAAAILVLSLAWPYYGMRAEAMPWGKTALAIGGAALLAATVTRQPIWWRIMHATFMPLAWAVTQLEIDPAWFLLAFGLMLLVYRGALTGQIPLFFSNQATVARLDELLSCHSAVRFADLGAGIGSIVLPLARRHPEMHFVGIENAPLTWLVGWLRTRGQKNLEWRWGNLWDVKLDQFNLVYAFLSPAPMQRLWEKVQLEMAEGMFISNSFEVPGVAPDQVFDADSLPPRALLCYRVAP